MKTLSMLVLVGVVFFAPLVVAQERDVPPVVEELLGQIEMMAEQLMALGERLGGEEVAGEFAEGMEQVERMRDEFIEMLAGVGEREEEEEWDEGEEEWEGLGRSLTFERSGGGEPISLSCAANKFGFSRHNEGRTAEHGEGGETESVSVATLNFSGEIFPMDDEGRYLVHVNWEEMKNGNTGEVAEGGGGSDTQSEFSTHFSGSSVVVGERVMLLQDGPRELSLVVTEQ